LKSKDDALNLQIKSSENLLRKKKRSKKPEKILYLLLK